MECPSEALPQHAGTFYDVSERSLVARINRKLAPEQRSLRKSRPNSRDFHSIGLFFLLENNTVVDTHVDIVLLGKELGVLHPRERVVAVEGG